MKITEETIPLIEKALDIKLYPWQKEYLLNGTRFPDICPCLMYDFDDEIVNSCNIRFDGRMCRAKNRMTGKTTSHCIDLALSDGEPLNIKKPENFSDRKFSGPPSYHKGFFRRFFLDIWHQLKAAGLPVREVKF